MYIVHCTMYSVQKHECITNWYAVITAIYILLLLLLLLFLFGGVLSSHPGT